MSNQLQITGGAKVRSLEGVITGTSGVLSSVPLGGANGVATLDSSGKVPVSQLPASVVTYLGTWNAATNTPTLTNGVGDAGDLYICNVAGTVNFGAGPITFAVGDWVIYGSGTWQKSSGQNGTVTSVAASINGNAIGITGSPITTAGTLAFSFAGTSGQYINGAGNLVTFPSLSGYVPYTGATSNVDLGSYYLTTARLNSNEIKATTSGGIDIHSNSGTQVALFGAGGGSGTTFYGGINGTTANFSGQLTLGSTITNGTYTYTLPSATGTLALTSDLSSYVPTSRTLTINGVTYDLSANRSWTITSGVSSVFGRTGAVVAASGDYNTDLITEGSTNLYFTNARARAVLSTNVGSALTYNSTTGRFTLNAADSGTDGYLTSADYNYLAAKQASLGTGTTSQFLRGDLT